VGQVLADRDRVLARAVLEPEDQQRVLPLAGHEQPSTAVSDDSVGTAVAVQGDLARPRAAVEVEDADRVAALALRLDTAEAVLADEEPTTVGGEAHLVRETGGRHAEDLPSARDLEHREGVFQLVQNGQRAVLESHADFSGATVALAPDRVNGLSVAKPCLHGTSVGLP
jgi:hypothetical protein